MNIGCNSNGDSQSKILNISNFVFSNITLVVVIDRTYGYSNKFKQEKLPQISALWIKRRVVIRDAFT